VGLFGTIHDLKLYKCFYSLNNCTCMVYRISMSEETVRRVRDFARNRHILADEVGHAGNRRYGLTVEDIVCELLREAGF